MQSGDGTRSKAEGVTSRLRRQVAFDAALAAAATEDAEYARSVHSRRVIIPNRPQLAMLRMSTPASDPSSNSSTRHTVPAGDRHTALALVRASDEASRAAAHRAFSAAFVVWWQAFMVGHVRRAARVQREREAAERASQLAKDAVAKARQAALARQRQARLTRSVAVRAVVREAQLACDRAEAAYMHRRKRVRDECDAAHELCARAAVELEHAEQRQREWWQSTDRGRDWADAWKRQRVSVADAGMHTAGTADAIPYGTRSAT
jgi:hypothetical protein